MGLIDVGAGAADYDASSNWAGYTVIDYNNAANDTGVLDVIELWTIANSNNVKVGTFDEVAANTFSSRDYVALGTVTGGSKQTFSGLSIDVASGDFLGAIATSSDIEQNNSLGNGKYRLVGDKFGLSNVDFGGIVDNQKLALYGTGATPPAGWTGKINGVTNPAKIWGIAVANISKVGGIA